MYHSNVCGDWLANLQLYVCSACVFYLFDYDGKHLKDFLWTCTYKYKVDIEAYWLSDLLYMFKKALPE